MTYFASQNDNASTDPKLSTNWPTVLTTVTIIHTCLYTRNFSCSYHATSNEIAEESILSFGNSFFMANDSNINRDCGSFDCIIILKSLRFASFLCIIAWLLMEEDSLTDKGTLVRWLIPRWPQARVLSNLMVEPM